MLDTSPVVLAHVLIFIGALPPKVPAPTRPTYCQFIILCDRIVRMVNLSQFSLQNSLQNRRANLLAGEGTVAKDNIADVSMAAVAVRNRTNTGTMPIGEVDVLNKHTIRVIFNADVVVATVHRAVAHRKVGSWAQQIELVLPVCARHQARVRRVELAVLPRAKWWGHTM